MLSEKPTRVGGTLVLATCLFVVTVFSPSLVARYNGNFSVSHFFPFGDPAETLPLAADERSQGPGGTDSGARAQGRFWSSSGRLDVAGGSSLKHQHPAGRRKVAQRPGVPDPRGRRGSCCHTSPDGRLSGRGDFVRHSGSGLGFLDWLAGPEPDLGEMDPGLGLSMAGVIAHPEDSIVPDHARVGVVPTRR